MHCNHFHGLIYVEKTSEQWSIGYYNSQKTRRGVWWGFFTLRRVKMIQRELYNVKNPLWKGDWRNPRKEDSKLIYNCTQSKLIYMNAKLLALRVCSYLSLKFNSNLLWTCDNCCPNSLRPSFPTHSLQIYCLSLVGPTYYTFGPQIKTLQLALSVGKTYALVSVTVKYGRIRSAPGESTPGRARKFSMTRWLSQS